MHDVWQNAVCALIASSPPDPEPLARLLRSPAPIPAGIRETIAELLCPGDPEYLFCRLNLEETGTYARDLETKLPSIIEYSRLRASGTSAQNLRNRRGGARGGRPNCV